jgi:hypothetical protein
VIVSHKPGRSIRNDSIERAMHLPVRDLIEILAGDRAEDVDFRLRAGSAAVDRGLVLPNVTGGFGGRAPDPGAPESGQPLPVNGPR